MIELERLSGGERVAGIDEDGALEPLREEREPYLLIQKEQLRAAHRDEIVVFDGGQRILRVATHGLAAAGIEELTPAERKLWALIRNDQLGVNFRRQHAIGNFIPDFVCIEKKLIIELDGSQHLEQEEYDEERT